MILDTTIIVGSERSPGRGIPELGDDDDVAIAAVTVAELMVGVELADRRHRGRRAKLVAALLEAVPVEPYDLDTARAHARILAQVQRAGRPRGAHDLIIAATALATNRVVLTADVAGFSDIPGLEVRFA